MTLYYIAPDGGDDDTIWRETDRPGYPEAILRNVGIHPEAWTLAARDLPHLDDTVECQRCGQRTADPASCPEATLCRECEADGCCRACAREDAAVERADAIRGGDVW